MEEPAETVAERGHPGATPSAFDLGLRNLVLDRIRQGVCVFDGDQRMLLFNRRYAEIYGLHPSQLRLGMSLREVVDLRYAAGTGPDMPADHYSAWRDRIGVADRVLDTEVTLRNGRVLAIHHEPIQGGGWVSTHEDITERSRAEAHVRHMAHHDALTGLPNRVMFADRLDRTLRRLAGEGLEDHRPTPRGQGWQVAVCFVDLDRFKDVNDTLGHAAGDELLRVVAHRIRGCLGPDGLLARLGGDEFAILLDPVPGHEAVAAMERVIAAVAPPVRLGDTDACVGASIGVALRSSWDPAAEPALLLRQADIALYRAKSDGRNVVRLFDATATHRLHRRAGA